MFLIKNPFCSGIHIFNLLLGVMLSPILGFYNALLDF